MLHWSPADKILQQLMLQAITFLTSTDDLTPFLFNTHNVII